jgi:hypothetical protein
MRAVGERLRVGLQRVRLVLPVNRLIVAARHPQDLEQLLAFGLGELHQLVGVADVVLHGALLARVEAAAEADDQHDQQDQPSDDGYGAPHHERLAVGRRTARRAARRAACRLVRFVEKGQANRS